MSLDRTLVVEAPALDNDESRSLCARELNERRVVANLIAHLARAGFELHSASDGEERHRVATTRDALEIIFSVDESHLYVKKPGGVLGNSRYAIFFVLGNAEDGSEVVCDYASPDDDVEGFGVAMDAFYDTLDELVTQ